MFKSIFKSLGYNIISTFISVIQILALVLYTVFFKVDFDFNQIILNCSLLFICTSQIIFIVLNYYFGTHRYPKAFEGIFFIFFPLLLILTIILIYTGILSGAELNEQHIKDAHGIIIGFSLLYAIIYQSLIFYTKEKK